MKINVMWLLPLALVVVMGCGKKADTNKPMEEVRAEAQTMSAKELESSAKAYASEINRLKPEMEKIQAKLKDLAPTELLGDKAKGIKEEISKVSSRLSALTQRYDVYAEQYKKVGGDLSAIQIS